MYKTIMVPVDLNHLDKLGKALEAASDLGKLYGARVVVAGVTATTPSAAAHNPDEFAERLQELAGSVAKQHGCAVEAHAATSPDPAIDVDDTLNRVAHEIGADLIVMASHVPGFAEYVFASNAGWLASHTDLSVFVVR